MGYKFPRTFVFLWGITFPFLSVAGTAWSGETVAVINGVSISQATYERNWPAFLKTHGVSPLKVGEMPNETDLKRQALNSLIDRELLYQEAVRRGYAASDRSVDSETNRICSAFPSTEAVENTLKRSGFTREEYREHIRRRLTAENFLKEAVAGRIAVLDREVTAAYLSDRERFQIPEQIHLRHILIRVPSGARPLMEEAARKKCEGLLEALHRGDDFTELARKHSDCPSSSSGGDLGYAARGRFGKTFEEAAFSLPPGSLSGSVRTPYGYHIVSVEERRAGRQVPLEEVAIELENSLRQEKIEREIDILLKSLHSKASLTITAGF